MERELPTCDTAQALEFLSLWHTPEALVTLTLLQPGARGRVAVLCETVQRFEEMLRADGLETVVHLQDVNWNVYHSAGTLSARPEAGRRGGKKLMQAQPGVWLDLDVDEGKCRSYEHAWEVAHSLGAWPTIVVATGTGGLHAYWKTARPLEPAEGELLGQMLHAHAERVSGVSLDHVANCDRILRLPGSIRWPKGTERATLCHLLSSGGPVEDDQTLRNLWHSSWDDRVAHQQQTRAKVLHLELDARRIAAAASGGNHWAALMAVADLEQRFNATWTWDAILEPHGWQYLHSDSDGRRVWTFSRDGNHSSRSATTDWPRSPDVMSLLTRDPACRLVELHSARIPLTKYRVHCQLAYDGDEKRMVEDLLRVG